MAAILIQVIRIQVIRIVAIDIDAQPFLLWHRPMNSYW